MWEGPPGSGTRVRREPGLRRTAFQAWLSPWSGGGAPGIARAPGMGNPGRRLTGEQTDRATDAQEIDVTAPDEQRVRNTHEPRITCNEPDCPGSVRHVDSAKGHIRRHMRGNMPRPAGYSRTSYQPWRSQVRDGSAVAAADGPAGGRCWQSHQEPPGHSSWCRFR